MTTTSSWTSLNWSPCVIRHGNLLVLDSNKLLFIPMKFEGEQKSLWIYNIKHNNWLKWIDCPKHIDWRYQCCSLNKAKMILYIFDESGHIIQVNLKTKQFKISHNTFHDGSHSKSLFMNENFHIFGGWEPENKYHFIWKEKEQRLDEIYKFNDLNGDNALNSHSLMYLSSKQSALIMPFFANSIYLYSMITNKCNEIPIKSSMFRIHGFVKGLLTKYEKVICFMNNRMINILDLKSMKVLQSKIESPTDIDLPIPQICIRSDHYKEEIVTFGHIRECWNLSEFSELMYPPYYLIKIIESFINYQVIHILSHESHFSINVDDILSHNVDKE